MVRLVQAFPPIVQDATSVCLVFLSKTEEGMRCVAKCFLPAWPG